MLFASFAMLATGASQDRSGETSPGNKPRSAIRLDHCEEWVYAVEFYRIEFVTSQMHSL